MLGQGECNRVVKSVRLRNLLSNLLRALPLCPRPAPQKTSQALRALEAIKSGKSASA